MTGYVSSSMLGPDQNLFKRVGQRDVYIVCIGNHFSLQKAVLHIGCEPRGFGGSDLIAIAAFISCKLCDGINHVSRALTSLLCRLATLCDMIMRALCESPYTYEPTSLKVNMQ